MRQIAESGFGIACNSMIALLVAIMLVGSPQARAANAAPVISGKAPSSVVVGNRYLFRPTASDANRNTLRFTIRNKPRWGSFEASTGKLSGWPTAAHIGTYRNIIISVTDGMATRSLPAISITVKARTASATGNTAPRISGTPLTSVPVGSTYNFKPTASDANGDRLAFSITNKPAWASFSTSTGLLSGTPSSSHVGSTNNISIKVTDGRLTTSLPTFAVAVTQIGSGSATVSWIPPTSNTNGSTLTNLAGYRIKYGNSASALNRTLQIANPGITRYVLSSLGAGTWYFGVVAYTSGGAESSISQLATKTIR